jgi:hypothetical protein
MKSEVPQQIEILQIFFSNFLNTSEPKKQLKILNTFKTTETRPKTTENTSNSNQQLQ